jgi:hypothetical protein
MARPAHGTTERQRRDIDTRISTLVSVLPNIATSINKMSRADGNFRFLQLFSRHFRRCDHAVSEHHHATVFTSRSKPKRTDGPTMPPNSSNGVPPSIMFGLPDIDDINVDMCCGRGEEGVSSGHSKDNSTCSSGSIITAGEVAHPQQIAHSPVSIAADLLDARAAAGQSSDLPPPPPHHPASHDYAEGRVAVTRAARKRRIQRGCLASGGSEEYTSYGISYRIYRPELLRSASAMPLLVLHGGP